MKIEEIENSYNKEIENLDKTFLEDLKKNKDRKLLERNYKQKLNSIRIIYETKYQKYLKKQHEIKVKEIFITIKWIVVI